MIRARKLTGRIARIVSTVSAAASIAVIFNLTAVSAHATPSGTVSVATSAPIDIRGGDITVREVIAIAERQVGEPLESLKSATGAIARKGTMTADDFYQLVAEGNFERFDWQRTIEPPPLEGTFSDVVPLTIGTTPEFIVGILNARIYNVVVTCVANDEGKSWQCDVDVRPA
ncbi:hypothetical protein ABZU75_21925 [Streptosporangium sp. NPDC005286]|uniref:hypothetical protein n=1 Tax=Streptosporangium sp. NPDC005286 TaxID=3154463 RepID=UPI0033A520F4